VSSLVPKLQFGNRRESLPESGTAFQAVLHAGTAWADAKANSSAVKAVDFNREVIFDTFLTQSPLSVAAASPPTQGRHLS
jgi:hypothetical protein